MSGNTETRNAVIYINGVEVNNTLRSIQAQAKILNSEIALLSRGSAAYNAKAAQIANVNGILNKHKTQVSGISKSWENIKQNAVGTIGQLGVMLAGAAIVGGLGGLITKSAELADAITGVRRTTGLTEAQMDQLQSKFKEFNTRTPRKELLALAEEAGKQGKTTVDSVALFVDEMNKAQMSLGGDLGTSTITSLGKLTTIFDISSLKIGNAIKAIADSSIASAPYQVDFMMRTAGVAKTVDITADALLGYGATLENLGQSQEVSATAINQFLLKMTSNTEKFGAIAGFTAGELTKLIGEEGTNVGFVAFLEKLKSSSVGTSDLINKLNNLGLDGTRNAAVLLSLANNTSLLATQQEIAKKAIGETTLVMEGYNQANTNFAANWEKFMKQVGGWFISNPISQGFLRLVENIISTRTETEKMTDEWISNTAALQEVEKNVQPLVEEYNRLNSKQDKSREEQLKLNQTIRDIAILLPSAVSKWDEYGNAIDISTSKVTQHIAAEKELLRLKHVDAVKNAFEDIDALITQITYKTAELKSGQTTSYTSGSGASATSTAMSKAQMDKLRSDIDQAKGEIVDTYILIETQLGQTLSVADQMNMQLYGMTSTGIQLSAKYFSSVAEDATTTAATFVVKTEEQIAAEQAAAEALKQSSEKRKETTASLNKFIKSKIDELAKNRMSADEQEIQSIRDSYAEQILLAQGHKQQLAEMNALMEQEIQTKRIEQNATLLNDQAELSQELWLLLQTETLQGEAQIDQQFEAIYANMVKLHLDTTSNLKDFYRAWEQAKDEYYRKIKEKDIKAAQDSLDTQRKARQDAQKERDKAENNTLALENRKIEAQERYNESVFMSGVAAVENAKTQKEAIKGVINAVRDAIKARIMEAVAEAVASALSSVPFPFNIALATLAGAGASALFDKLIPQFATGTDNAPAGLKLVGEEGPELIYDNGGYGILPNNQTMEVLKSKSGNTYNYNNSVLNGNQSSTNSQDLTLHELMRELIHTTQNERYIVLPYSTLDKFQDELNRLNSLKFKGGR